MEIRKIHIKNFKSLVDVELINPNPFSVFVGPNGAGKSNIFAALELFVGLQSRMRDDLDKNERDAVAREIEDTIKQYFGSTSDLISVTSNSKWIGFSMISDFIESFALRFGKYKNGELDDLIGNNFVLENERLLEEYRKEKKPKVSAKFVRIFLNSIDSVRIPQRSDMQLQSDGANLEKVLKRLLLDETKRDEIVEWMQILVPEFKDIKVETSELSGTESLVIFEKSTGKPFPKHLISDGTKNILALLTAVFQSDEPQFLCIEEPENGLNPKVIREFVNLFRSVCESKGHFIWLNTHSQTLINSLEPKELILVNKKNGATIVKQLKDVDLKGMKLDEALFTNLLNGGIPW